MNDFETITGPTVVTSLGSRESAVSGGLISGIHYSGQYGDLEEVNRDGDEITAPPADLITDSRGPNTGRQAPGTTVHQPLPNTPYLDGVMGNIPSFKMKSYLVLMNALFVGFSLCAIFGTVRPALKQQYLHDYGPKYDPLTPKSNLLVELTYSYPVILTLFSVAAIAVIPAVKGLFGASVVPVDIDLAHPPVTQLDGEDYATFQARKQTVETQRGFTDADRKRFLAKQQAVTLGQGAPANWMAAAGFALAMTLATSRIIPYLPKEWLSETSGTFFHPGRAIWQTVAGFGLGGAALAGLPTLMQLNTTHRDIPTHRKKPVESFVGNLTGSIATIANTTRKSHKRLFQAGNLAHDVLVNKGSYLFYAVAYSALVQWGLNVNAQHHNPDVPLAMGKVPAPTLPNWRLALVIFAQFCMFIEVSHLKNLRGLSDRNQTTGEEGPYADTAKAAQNGVSALAGDDKNAKHLSSLLTNDKTSAAWVDRLDRINSGYKGFELLISLPARFFWDTLNLPIAVVNWYKNFNTPPAYSAAAAERRARLPERLYARRPIQWKGMPNATEKHPDAINVRPGDLPEGRRDGEHADTRLVLRGPQGLTDAERLAADMETSYEEYVATRPPIDENALKAFIEGLQTLDSNRVEGYGKIERALGIDGDVAASSSAWNAFWTSLGKSPTALIALAPLLVNQWLLASHYSRVPTAIGVLLANFAVQPLEAIVAAHIQAYNEESTKISHRGGIANVEHILGEPTISGTIEEMNAARQAIERAGDDEVWAPLAHRRANEATTEYEKLETLLSKDAESGLQTALRLAINTTFWLAPLVGHFTDPRNTFWMQLGAGLAKVAFTPVVSALKAKNGWPETLLDGVKYQEFRTDAAIYADVEVLIRGKDGRLIPNPGFRPEHIDNQKVRELWLGYCDLQLKKVSTKIDEMIANLERQIARLRGMDLETSKRVDDELKKGTMPPPSEEEWLRLTDLQSRAKSNAMSRQMWRELDELRDLRTAGSLEPLKLERLVELEERARYSLTTEEWTELDSLETRKRLYPDGEPARSEKTPTAKPTSSTADVERQDVTELLANIRRLEQQKRMLKYDWPGLDPDIQTILRSALEGGNTKQNFREFWKGYSGWVVHLPRELAKNLQAGTLMGQNLPQIADAAFQLWEATHRSHVPPHCKVLVEATAAAVNAVRRELAADDLHSLDKRQTVEGPAGTIAAGTDGTTIKGAAGTIIVRPGTTIIEGPANTITLTETSSVASTSLTSVSTSAPTSPAPSLTSTPSSTIAASSIITPTPTTMVTSTTTPTSTTPAPTGQPTPPGAPPPSCDPSSEPNPKIPGGATIAATIVGSVAGTLGALAYKYVRRGEKGPFWRSIGKSVGESFYSGITGAWRMNTTAKNAYKDLKAAQQQRPLNRATYEEKATTGGDDWRPPSPGFPPVSTLAGTWQGGHDDAITYLLPLPTTATGPQNSGNRPAGPSSAQMQDDAGGNDNHSLHRQTSIDSGIGLEFDDKPKVSSDLMTAATEQVAMKGPRNKKPTSKPIYATGVTSACLRHEMEKNQPEVMQKLDAWFKTASNEKGEAKNFKEIAQDADVRGLTGDFICIPVGNNNEPIDAKGNGYISLGPGTETAVKIPKAVLEKHGIKLEANKKVDLTGGKKAAEKLDGRKSTKKGKSH